MKSIKPPRVSGITGLLNPCLQRQVEQIWVSVFEAKLVENGLNDLLASGLIRNWQCFVLDIGAQNSGVDFDHNLKAEMGR